MRAHTCCSCAVRATLRCLFVGLQSGLTCNSPTALCARMVWVHYVNETPHHHPVTGIWRASNSWSTLSAMTSAVILYGNACCCKRCERGVCCLSLMAWKRARRISSAAQSGCLHSTSGLEATRWLSRLDGVSVCTCRRGCRVVCVSCRRLARRPTRVRTYVPRCAN